MKLSFTFVVLLFLAACTSDVVPIATPTLAPATTVAPSATATNTPVPTTTPTLIPTPTPTSTLTPAINPIQHVVIFIQENHSFDAMFAGLSGTDGTVHGSLCADQHRASCSLHRLGVRPHSSTFTCNSSCAAGFDLVRRGRSVRFTFVGIASPPRPQPSLRSRLGSCSTLIINLRNRPMEKRSLNPAIKASTFTKVFGGISDLPERACNPLTAMK